LSTRSGADLAAFFSTRVEQTARLTAAVFPGTTVAVGALTMRSTPAAFGQMALLALLSAVALVIMLAAGRLLYFKGVIGLSTAASRRKALSSDELDRQLGVGARPHPIAAFVVYMQKDFRILVRTPIFLMNNVIMNFLFPLFLAVPIIGAGSQDEDIRQLQVLVQGLVDARIPRRRLYSWRSCSAWLSCQRYQRHCRKCPVT
jgi:ABC-2 type transport system permease protein